MTGLTPDLTSSRCAPADAYFGGSNYFETNNERRVLSGA